MVATLLSPTLWEIFAVGSSKRRTKASAAVGHRVAGYWVTAAQTHTAVEQRIGYCRPKCFERLQRTDKELLMLHYSLRAGIFLLSSATCSTLKSIFCRDKVLCLGCYQPELDFAERSYTFTFHILFLVFTLIYGKTHCALLCIGNSLLLRRINHSIMLKSELRSTSIIYVTKGEKIIFTFCYLLQSWSFVWQFMTPFFLPLIELLSNSN